MSTRLILGGFCALLVLGGSIVRAEDASTSPETVPANPPPVVAPPLPKDPEAYERRKTQFAPLTKDRVKNLLENVMNRLESATMRLDRIANRIETRIAKEEAVGRDVTASREALARARTELERARRESSMVTEIQMDLIVDSDAPRVAFQNLYGRIVTTRTALENAKRELSVSIEGLSGDVPQVEAATSTPEEDDSTPATTTTP